MLWIILRDAASRLLGMRAVGVAACLIILAAGVEPGRAQGTLPAIPAREAHEARAASKLILIDIRTPEEWADTGVPQGALRLDAESGGFEVRLAGIRLDNPARRIALIDRTGGLSTSVQQKLAGRGWRNLVVVRGGMLGPGGWLAEKLPLEK